MLIIRTNKDHNQISFPIETSLREQFGMPAKTLMLWQVAAIDPGLKKHHVALYTVYTLCDIIIGRDFMFYGWDFIMKHWISYQKYVFKYATSIIY